MAYILNLTNTILTVGKYAEIKPGKYIHADKFVLESEEVAYALRAKWATLHDDVPSEISFGEDSVVFHSSAAEGSSEYPGEAKLEPEPEVAPEAEATPEAVEETPAPKKATKAKAAPTAE